MTPTFSVLLPTRNGGKYLDNCIRSILDQADSDVELIISDNANTDETPEILNAYRDNPLVKILRTEEVASVTENWNNALSGAQGKYVLMMGDDDYLLPGYFDLMRGILARHGNPDCVLYNGYSFVAPSSIADNQASYFSESHFRFGNDLTEERELGKEECHGLVRDMFSFRVRIPLNMQTTLVKREAGALVPGGMFQAPFPDHFALNSLLLAGARWVFSPTRPVVVGVSPKSFGHFVYSNQQNAGLAYLGIKAKFPGQLPGNELLNGMHIWLDMLLNSFKKDLKGVKIDRAGYVRRQIYSWIVQWKLGMIPWKEVAGRLSLLSFGDWLGLAATLFDGESWQRGIRLFSGGRRSEAEQQWQGLQQLDNIPDIAAFSRWLVSTGRLNKEAL